MNDTDYLNTLDKDLNYYRGRLNTIINYSLVTQVLIITGKYTIGKGSTNLNQIIYTIAFVLIYVNSFIFIRHYSSRTGHLVKKKIEFLKEKGYTHYFGRPQPAFRVSFLYSMIILFLSLIGIFIIWV